MSPLSLTPEERSARASIAALELHAQVDSREHLCPAVEASPARLAYFERQVDPDNKLDPAERARRADLKRRAHFQRLAYKSARARKRKQT